MSDWTPPVMTPHEEDVEVYSNADEVELRLNGRPVGRLPKPLDDAPRIFKVRFEKGTLTAVARNRGAVVATHELKTAGSAARIVLKSDRASVTTPGWDELAHVTAEIVDVQGVLVPGAADEITFAVSGPGRVIAVDNGDPQSHEPYQANKRRAFQSRCLALVRTTAWEGRVTVTAQAPGLEAGSVSFDVKPRFQ